MAEDVRTFVTLIHGTWASRAHWVRADSRLVAELTRNLAKPVSVTAFPWGGRNSSTDRDLAAHRLADILFQQVELHPSALHVVVGHSHGGNLALKAVELAHLFATVHVVCLSTPFFQVSRRDYGQDTGESIIALGATTCFAAGGWYVLHKILPEALRTGSFPMFLTIPFLLLATLFWFRWKRKAARSAALFEIKIPSSASLMIVRTIADEASSAIATFQFLSWLLTRGMRLCIFAAGFVSALFLWVSQLPGRFSRRQKFLFWAACLSAAVAALKVMADLDLSHPANHWGRYLPFLILLAMAVFVMEPVFFLASLVPLLALGALVPVILILMASAILPMGLERF